MAASTKLFSWNYDVHNDDGDDGEDLNVDFEDTDSNGSSDFQGKNDSKASESEVVCTDSDIGYMAYHVPGLIIWMAAMHYG